MAEFCLRSLVPRLADRIDVDIILIEDFCKNQGSLGTCTWEDTNDRPRVFLIEADSSQRMRGLLITIAHEMVHVKQFARNEQKQMLVGGVWKWKGKPVDVDKTDYWELPWEIEANGREVGLFINWCKENNLQNMKWTFDRNEL